MTWRQVVLWRHGRTDWNVQGRAQGMTDVPLDDVGREQARSAAARLASLKPAFIWSSDLSRARDTAGELAGLTGLDVRSEPRLREIRMGEREGLTQDDVRSRFPEVYQAWQLGEDPPRAVGGEVDREVGERVAAVIGEAGAALASGEVGVLVSHGVAIRTGLCRFLGLPEEHWHLFAGVSNCAWVVLSEWRRGWRIVDFNAGSLPEPVLSDDELAPES
ncbi:MAG: histidine phosphatase family protein [Propionibacteriales bacterium]|nr:histidine phosphatase family protein [Propionibacteriales bacterium]